MQCPCVRQSDREAGNVDITHRSDGITVKMWKNEIFYDSNQISHFWLTYVAPFRVVIAFQSANRGENYRRNCPHWKKNRT